MFLQVQVERDRDWELAEREHESEIEAERECLADDELLIVVILTRWCAESCES